MKGMEELLGRYKRVRQINNLYGINIIIIVIIVEYALHLEIIELQTTQKIFKRLKFNEIIFRLAAGISFQRAIVGRARQFYFIAADKRRKDDCC